MTGARAAAPGRRAEGQLGGGGLLEPGEQPFDFRRLARFASADLLQARLHTGRTHQIRVHLASVGHPVLGDDTYGGGGGRRLAGLPPRRHWLHAAWLRFSHPVTGVMVDLRSPLPSDLTASLATLAEGALEVATLDALGFFAPIG